MMSASLRPARLSMLMIAPSGKNSRSDCSTTSGADQPPGTAPGSHMEVCRPLARYPPRKGSTTNAATP